MLDYNKCVYLDLTFEFGNRSDNEKIVNSALKPVICLINVLSGMIFGIANIG